MSVPESIRKVKRPKNTVVEDSGRNTDMRYSVRERAGEKYVHGHNPSPRNGKVIGHIINGKYVSIEEESEIIQRSPGSSAKLYSPDRSTYAPALVLRPK